MFRIVFLLALASVGCRLIFGRWPWDFLAHTSPRQLALTRARKLLGIGATASHAEVIEAHRRLVVMVHPDRGGTNEQVHEANAARDMLLGELTSEG